MHQERENAVVEELLAGRVVGVETEADAHRDQREGDRKAEHDDEDEQTQHQHADLRIGHFPFPVTARLRSFSVLAVDALLLENDAFRLFDVVQASRPGAAPDAQDAADDFRHTLNQQKYAGDRNECLQRKHRNAGGAEDAHFSEADRGHRVGPAGIDERQHGREEKQDVERKIHGRLRSRAPQPIEHVAADVTVARQRVGAGHQEQRTVVDIAEVEGPGRRRPQCVAHEHLVADAEGQHQNQPGECLADPGTEGVNEIQKLE